MKFFNPAMIGTTNKGNTMSKDTKDTIVLAETTLKTVVFSFRPQPLTDEDGNSTKIDGAVYIDHEVDKNGNTVFEDDGVTPKALFTRKKPATKRQPVTVDITYPTLAAFGIQEEPLVATDGTISYQSPTLQLLFEQIVGVIDGEARAYLDTGKVPTAEDLDWSVIAAKPKNQRASSSKNIDKDTLLSFVDSFVAAMSALGKNKAGIEAQAKFFKARLRGAENMENKRLELIQGNVATWFTSLNEDQQADQADAYEYVNDKLEKALASDIDLNDLL